MDRFPLVTIGLTCHDASATIARAVQSAAAQNWPHVEILVVDDASQDESVSVIERLRTEEPRLRLIALDRNVGVAEARNRLIENARGEFIAFFDDDDVSDPERLAVQVARIQDYEAATGAGLVLCHTARRVTLPDGSERVVPAIGMDVTPAPHGEEVFDYIMTGRGARRLHGAGATCSQMARRSVYRQLGGFDPALRRSEDTELNLRAALAGAHFAGVSRPLVAQTMTHCDDKAPAAERAATLALLEKHGRHPRVRAWHRFNCDWCEFKYDLAMGRPRRAATRLAGLAVIAPVKTSLRLARSLPTRQSRRGLAAARAAAESQVKGPESAAHAPERT